MKKIQIALIAFIVAFAFVYAQPSNRVQALVISKAASITAKKVAKDFIKESAKEIAFEMAMQAISQTWDSKNDYKFEETHYGFCADVITPDGKCTRVLQVKKDLTPYDIENVDAQLDIEIDKAITSGSGMTKWQKFMDWFLPIWIVSFALTALTYAMDGNVRDLFNQIAFDTLVSLGLIKPAPLKVEPIPQIVDKTTLVAIPEDSPTVTSVEVINDGAEVVTNLPNISYRDTIIVTQFDHSIDVATYPKIGLSYNADTKYDAISSHLYNKNVNPLNTANLFYNQTTTVYKDDTVIWTAPDKGGIQAIPGQLMPGIEKTKAVMLKTAYQAPGQSMWYTDYTIYTESGTEYLIRGTILPSHVENTTIPIVQLRTSITDEFNSNPTIRTPPFQTATKQTVYTNATSVSFKPYDPLYTELQSIDVPKTKYENDAGEVTLVPPVAIPLIQTSTGQKITVTPNPIAGEEPILTNEDGEIVSDDDVTAGDPDITESPEGVTQVTPPSSQTDPNPVPIPLDPPVPPTEPPLPTESPPPEDGGGGKPNIPMELLLGLFKLLFAIIFYLIRMITFIVTIQFIQPIPIPNPYFIWFTTAEILGVQPYPLIKNIALFFLSFSIYKSIRRVF